MKSILLTALLILPLLSWSQNPTKVKVGSTPTISSAAIYLALEKGYFKEENIEPELIITGNSGAPLTLLLSKGELDVGAGGFTSGLFNAINKGEKFKVVADKGHVAKGKEYLALIVRKDLVDSGKFKSIKDLKGLKIGMPSLDGVSQQVVMDGILKKAGLTEKDIQYVKASYPEINVALKTKTIDATIQLEPFLTKAVIDGVASKILSTQEIVPDQQSAAIFYSPKFAAEQSEVAVKFMRAYIRGIRLYNDGLKDKKVWAEIVTSLKKHIKIDDEKVWNEMIPVGLRNDGRIHVDGLKEDLKWYKEKGFIEKIPDTKEFVDHSFADKAVSSLDSKNKKNNK